MKILPTATIRYKIVYYSIYSAFKGIAKAVNKGESIQRREQAFLAKKKEMKQKLVDVVKDLFKAHFSDDGHLWTLVNDIFGELVIHSTLPAKKRLEILLKSYIALYAPGLQGHHGEHIKYLFNCAVEQLGAHIANPFSVSLKLIEVINVLRYRGKSTP